MTNIANTRIKIRFMQLRELFGNVCCVCLRKEKLEFAHIKHNGFNGMGRGRKERFYDIIRNINNYILVCKWCHKMMDSVRI